jgi:soluble lytic murein transglycosylase-like protein
MTVQDQITAAANAAGVPAWLALAIAQRESSFDNNAVGSKGEIGIFQLLPSTAAQLGVDPHDPVQNIAGGVAYLAQLMRTFGGDTQKTAAAFNCGPTCVASAVSAAGDNWATRIPSSTLAYVAGVTGSIPLPTAPLQMPAVQPAPPLYAGLVPPSVSFDWQPWAWGGAALFGFVILRRIGQAG